MKQNKKLAVATIAVICLGTFFYIVTVQTDSIEVNHTAAEQNTAQISHNLEIEPNSIPAINAPAVASALSPVPENRPDTLLIENEIAKIRQKSVERRQAQYVPDDVIESGILRSDISSFASLDDVLAVHPALNERRQSDSRQFIQYHPYVLETRFVGDTIDFPIEEIGLTLTGTISDIQVEPDGEIITFTGHFENFNSETNRFRISQTLIDQYVVGSLLTPLGEFDLESKNGYGWLAISKDEFHLPENGIDGVSPE